MFMEGEMTETPDISAAEVLQRAARNGSLSILSVVVFGSIRN
jgi:hypothetical protein